MDDVSAVKANLVKSKPEEQLVKLPRSIKEIEAEEPILKENKGRFVLFPIKYHEVCTASRVK